MPPPAAADHSVGEAPSAVLLVVAASMSGMLMSSPFAATASRCRRSSACCASTCGAGVKVQGHWIHGTGGSTELQRPLQRALDGLLLHQCINCTSGQSVRTHMRADVIGRRAKGQLLRARVAHHLLDGCQGGRQTARRLRLRDAVVRGVPTDRPLQNGGVPQVDPHLQGDNRSASGTLPPGEHYLGFRV